MVSWLKKVRCIIHIKGHLFGFQFSTIPLTANKELWGNTEGFKMDSYCWNCSLEHGLSTQVCFSSSLFCFSFLFLPPSAFIAPLYPSLFFFFFDTNSNFARAEIASIFNWMQKFASNLYFVIYPYSKTHMRAHEFQFSTATDASRAMKLLP